MSDPKNDNKQLEFMVQSIANKLNSSAVLNGGFDKMMVVVEHIQEKQEETAAKVHMIHEGLYHPDDGLYARVKMVEIASNRMAENQQEHFQMDDKNMDEINASLKKLATTDDTLTKQAETTQKLKKITGEDLEKLADVIDVKTSWTDGWKKIAWFIVAAIAGAGGKALWELIVSHH